MDTNLQILYYIDKQSHHYAVISPIVLGNMLLLDWKCNIYKLY